MSKQVPTGFFTDRVADDGCVDTPKGFKTFLAFYKDQPPHNGNWCVYEGEHWVSVTIDVGAVNYEARFTECMLREMLDGLRRAKKKMEEQR